MLNNKWLLQFFIGILTVLILLSLYSIYHASHKYITLQNTETLSSFLTEMEALSSHIEDERHNSAVYMVKESKNTLLSLQDERALVDKTLIDLEKRFKKTYPMYINKIKQIDIALEEVRKKVDGLSIAYREILFYDYHSRIIQQLLVLLKEIRIEQSSEENKDLLLIYDEYTKLKENANLERSSIYFVLLGSSIMSDMDLKLWEQLSGKDTLASFDSLTDRTLLSKIEALNSAKAYDAMISRERKMISREAKRGTYSISPEGWLNEINKKIEYCKKIQVFLRTEIQKKEQTKIVASKQELIFNVVILLALLLLLYKLFSIYHQLKRSKKISLETAKDIALVFTLNQQEELQKLINEGRIDHIYKFLIKTIMDANQTKDLFLASMSHEIRTPLNGILGFTQLLKESDATEEQAEFISVIEKSSENLLTIVNDILDLSKIKAQKIELENIEFDPIDSFETAVESYAAKADEEHIDFNVFVDPELPTLLMGDPTKISQIIVNLISNAMKFTPQNGEVNVNIEKSSESRDEVQVKFEVTDTGIGITKEQKSKIFEAFSQADVSTSREYGGTGLGLSISGKFVELMGGKLSIWSVQDEGATFYFNLSLKKPKSATSRKVNDIAVRSVGILNSHIDDVYCINKNLEAYINFAGVKVIHYTNESLLLLKKRGEEVPDILFIDHKFRLRGGEIEPFLNFDTKIVVMSTGDQKRNLKRYQSQIDKILYKPVNFTKTIKILTQQEDHSQSEDKITFEDIHVLLAEDNLINQKLFVNVFNRLGIEVSIANNGREALELRMKHKYDMIFMDIEMPVMGGMEATGQILSYERQEEDNHIPIVALTANALTGDREKYLGAGMDDYLSKPIHLDVLKQLLQRYFKKV